MPIWKWVTLLTIALRFRFTEAECRARRDVFERSTSLDPVTLISLAGKYSVSTTFIVRNLEHLVRRKQPLLEREIVELSGEVIARLGVAREKYLRRSSRVFTSEERWLR